MTEVHKIQRISSQFKVTQLDNSWACSSLLFKNLGPKVGENISRNVKYFEVKDPDVFFQMFDNLFRTKYPNDNDVTDQFGNLTDFFGQNIGTSSCRPHQYGFFIFYCARDQIPTTGKFLEELGCSVQKSFATKINNPVAIYVIESWKFLDQYEEWMVEVKKEGHEVFGTMRTQDQKPKRD